MRITVTERVLHFREPAMTSRGTYTDRRIWIVTVSDGVRQGVGECAPLPDLSCDYDIYADEPVAAAAYGARLRQWCDEVEATGRIDAEAMRPFPSMLFGLETALADLEATAQPELTIPINGLVWMGNHEEMLRRMEQKLELGFRCVKLKVGAIDFDSELDLVKRIRRRFSRQEVELRLDANGGFRPDEALDRLTLLARYDIHSIEQPVKAGQWETMAALCRQSPLPIALDEELIGVNDPEQKRQLLHTIRPAYIVLKPSLHGAVSGCREWLSLAREAGIGSWLTSALESNIGLTAIARLAAEFYGPDIAMPQGLGTGQLFTDNIPMSVEVRGDKLWVGGKNEKMKK